MLAGALSGEDSGDVGHNAADNSAVDAEQYDVEIPPGWKTVRRMALDCGVHMGTIRRHYKEYKTLPFRRLSDGRIIVNANEAPLDRIKGAQRHRKMMDEVRQEIVQRADAEPTDDDLSAVQLIRRHVRWLENLVKELQERNAADARDRKRMEAADRAERQRLMEIIDSLTAALPAPPRRPRRSAAVESVPTTTDPAPRPRRARRKTTETG
jgi:DNA-binding transcriptional regulator YhcF (GntR family)